MRIIPNLSFTFILAFAWIAPQTAMGDQKLDEALADAAMKNDVALVESLLKAGANPNSKVAAIPAADWAAEGLDPSEYSHDKAKKIFAALLKAGLDIHAKDSRQRTLVGRTMSSGHIKSAQVLIDTYGATFDPNEPEMMSYAIIANSFKAVLELHRRGTPLGSSLETAARICNPDMTLFLRFGGAEKGDSLEIAEKKRAWLNRNSPLLIANLRDCDVTARLIHTDLNLYPKLKNVSLQETQSFGDILNFIGLGSTSYGALNQAEHIEKILNAGPEEPATPVDPNEVDIPYGVEAR